MSDLNQDRIALDVLDATDKAYDRGFEAGVQAERERIAAELRDQYENYDDMDQNAFRAALAVIDEKGDTDA